ncbi:hypothetical protein KB206_17290 [Microvirga sp. STS02]|uniref:XAC2610-related protein n=1 Tax=Hymenobacter negativus TaxID=2795026 RepID=UPI0018DB5025|nr:MULTISPECIES: hypothetical protein [Bacteria]MBH8570651.1 hypothetical protein [Hymenobacter negativus]MBR7210389.1 hypothetical protein [Microvirga sp. STS02]
MRPLPAFFGPTAAVPGISGKWIGRLAAIGGMVLGVIRSAAAQASYTGQLGGARVEMLLEQIILPRGIGVYLYSKVGTPIVLNSNIRHGALVLTEYTADRPITQQTLFKTKYKPTATFTIPAFSFSTPVLHGTWRSLTTKRQLPLTLTLTTGPDDAGTAGAPPTALQMDAAPDYYFKTLLTGKSNDPATRVKAVQVIEKKTNRIIQQFPVNCRAIGSHNVSVDDYNFDGLLDFSIYEDDAETPDLASFGYNNSTSQYFLYDPAAKQFIASGFQGIGLRFDAQQKRVYRYTLSPSGERRVIIKTEYSVVHNRLVLTGKPCFE